MADKTPQGPKPSGRAKASAARTGAKGASGSSTSGKGSHAKGPRTKGAAAAGRRGWTWKRVGSLTLVGLLLAALLAGLAGLVFYNRTTLPDPNEEFTTNTTFLYYGDGKTKLGSFAVQNRQSLPYDQMNPSIKDAVVAAENRDFWSDSGISPSGIVRSAWTIARGGEVQGGSTITQQYIKVLYLSQDRTMARKLRELVLAAKMGQEMPKEEILQGYLNTVYYGRGAYGIQAASRSYFNTDAKDLTVPQAAVLASVLNNPSIYDPSAAKGNSGRLLNRYRYVLGGMLEGGKITQAQHDQWAKSLPDFPDIPLNQRWAGTNGYLLKMVQNELVAKGMSQGQVEGGGLHITTTFDKRLQERAVEVGNYYRRIVGDNGPGGIGAVHPAIASVEVGTGKVLAVYGGADYIKNTRNWATTDRPSASTFKAYATVAGLRNGMSLRTILRGNTYTPEGESVPVRNEQRHQYGPVSLRTALAKSINTAFVDMTHRIDNGPEEVIKAANDAGLPKGAGWEPNSRVSLGMAEVSPVENAGGYATFANEGMRVDNHVVEKVTDANGKVIYEADTKGEQAIEPGVARDVTSALRSVVSEGTGARVAGMGFQVAGKTGTNGITRDGEDIINSAWFVATTPQISTSVMFVAGDDGNGSLDEYKRPGDFAFFGGSYPAMAWRDFMKVAMEDREYKSFPEGDNVNYGQEQGPVQQPSPVRTTRPATQPTQGGERQGGASQDDGSQDDGSQDGQGDGSSAEGTGQPTQESTGGPTQQETQAQQPATQQPVQTRPATQPTQQVTQQAGGNGNGGGNAGGGNGNAGGAKGNAGGANGGGGNGRGNAEQGGTGDGTSTGQG